MTPDAGSPMRSKVSFDRSMMRPDENGPRSLTRHVVVWPVAVLVTVITVPSGAVRWAQVPAGASYHDAWPVWVFLGAVVVVVVGYGLAVVVVVGFGLTVVVVTAATVARAATIRIVVDVDEGSSAGLVANVTTAGSVTTPSATARDRAADRLAREPVERAASSAATSAAATRWGPDDDERVRRERRTGAHSMATLNTSATARRLPRADSLRTPPSCWGYLRSCRDPRRVPPGKASRRGPL